MKIIKVLMLVPDLKAANGVTSYAMNYFKKLDHKKIHMDFAIYSDELLVEDYKKEIEITGGKVFVLPRFFSFEHYAACKKIIKEGNYDIVHNNSLINTIPMMNAARCAKVSIRILHSHNSKMGETLKKEKRNQLFLPILKALSTHYAACSEVAGKAMFHKKKFVIIPNIIDGEKFKFSQEKRERVRKEMNIQDEYIIISVGRLAVQKNPFFALNVIKEIIKKDSNIEYWWVGDGPLQEQVKEYVNKLEIGNWVRFLGSRTDVCDLYQAADCFFMPSIFEGLGIICIEAQAMGLSCVISDVIPQLVDYTDLVERLTLSEDTSRWGMKILEKKNDASNRLLYEKKLADSVFSDVGAGNYLGTWYDSMIG